MELDLDSGTKPRFSEPTDSEMLDWLELQKDNGNLSLYVGGPWRWFSDEIPARGYWKFEDHPELGRHETAREAIATGMRNNRPYK
jgi:hypothetical protein